MSLRSERLELWCESCFWVALWKSLALASLPCTVLSDVPFMLDISMCPSDPLFHVSAIFLARAGWLHVLNQMVSLLSGFQLGLGNGSLGRRAEGEGRERSGQLTTRPALARKSHHKQSPSPQPTEGNSLGNPLCLWVLVAGGASPSGFPAPGTVLPTMVSLHPAHTFEIVPLWNSLRSWPFLLAGAPTDVPVITCLLSGSHPALRETALCDHPHPQKPRIVLWALSAHLQPQLTGPSVVTQQTLPSQVTYDLQGLIPTDEPS